MSNSRFNTVFAALILGATLCAVVLSPQVTGRVKGADVVLTPVVKPVRAIAGFFDRRFAHKPLPPGETAKPTDQQLATENASLKQQVAFLNQQLEDLRLVESERKRLGPLLQYFKPVTVIGGDATAGRESLSLMPTSGVEFAVGAPVMSSDGLAGRMIEGRRVRLITDPGYKITAGFGRWTDGVWTELSTPKAACTGLGDGTIRIDNLTVRETEALKPGDWATVEDANDYPEIVRGRPFAQVESIRPLPSKPLFAEIIVKPRSDLRKLREVLVLRK